MGAVTPDTAIAAKARSAPHLGSLRRWRRPALVAGSVLVLLIAIAFLVDGLFGQRTPTPLVVDVPDRPAGLAASEDAIWVALPGSGGVWPLDTSTGRAAGPGFRTGGAPSRLAAGAHGIWVADSSRGTVVPVEPAAERAYRALRVGADVTDVTLAAGAVWVASSAEGVVRALEADGRVHELRVGGQPVDLAAAGRWVVAAGAEGTLARIDTRSRRQVGAPLRVGGVPVAVAIAGDRAWLADPTSGCSAVPIARSFVYRPRRARSCRVARSARSRRRSRSTGPATSGSRQPGTGL